jgi:hypothetical protein
MAGPVEQVGEIGPCPRCGAEVLTKTTIPVLAADGVGLDYVCKVCARTLVLPDATPREPAPEPAPEASDG